MTEWIALFSSPYGLVLLGGVIASAALFWVMGRAEKISFAALFTTTLLALPLGLVCSRGYFIVTIDLLGAGFRGSFFSFQPYDYAFCGSMLGVLLACVVASRLTRTPARRLLNALACPALVLIAIARIAETWSDFGWGPAMNTAWCRRFPFSVQDAIWGEWHFALFYPEAVYALLVCAALFFSKRSKNIRFSLALIWWSMGQVFFESFRVETLKWGFVRVQQVQCAVFVAVVMIVACCQCRKGAAKGRLVLRSWMMYVLGVATVVFLEFALDKLTWPRWIDYTAMALVLCGMAGIAHRLVWIANTAKEEHP